MSWRLREFHERRLPVSNPILRQNRRGFIGVASSAAAFLGCSCGRAFSQHPAEKDAPISGAQKSTKSPMLGLSAEILQNDNPISAINMYLNGFHCIRTAWAVAPVASKAFPQNSPGSPRGTGACTIVRLRLVDSGRTADRVPGYFPSRTPNQLFASPTGAPRSAILTSTQNKCSGMSISQFESCRLW